VEIPHTIPKTLPYKLNRKTNQVFVYVKFINKKPFGIKLAPMTYDEGTGGSTIYPYQPGSRGNKGKQSI
jgi:hypothetical protein